MRSSIIEVLLATSGSSEGVTADAILSVLSRPAVPDVVRLALEVARELPVIKSETAWDVHRRYAEKIRSIREALTADGAASAPAVPEGWKLVPEEPTEKMIVELMCVGLRHAEYKPGCSPTVGEMMQGYKFMLSAAPSAQASAGAFRWGLA